MKKLLWVDFAAGAVTSLLGIFLAGFFAPIFGIPEAVLFWMHVVTLGYALVSSTLAIPQKVNMPRLIGLIAGNWLWVPVNLVLIYFYFGEATLLGKLFLISQIVFVGGLAYIEGRQLEKQPAKVLP
ncbi:MAG: hypothetical protein AAFR61_04310 [Bacteroidota bacterium]